MGGKGKGKSQPDLRHARAREFKARDSFETKFKARDREPAGATETQATQASKRARPAEPARTFVYSKQQALPNNQPDGTTKYSEHHLIYAPTHNQHHAQSPGSTAVMPRVRASGNPQAAAYASPVKTVSIPLNDDRSEKAARLQSRHIAHSKQLDQLKAAATPLKKRRSLGVEGPETPSQDDGGFGVRGDAVTPMKRVPILANFEEWMKMATDNKINANNSWNFALIDYFHDMSLLKEGDQINFQKASCTLDGCVKIYTSRVDSVATETGKLLSGLADSGNKKRKGDDSTLR